MTHPPSTYLEFVRGFPVDIKSLYIGCYLRDNKRPIWTLEVLRRRALDDRAPVTKLPKELYWEIKKHYQDMLLDELEETMRSDGLDLSDLDSVHFRERASHEELSKAELIINRVEHNLSLSLQSHFGLTFVLCPDYFDEDITNTPVIGRYEHGLYGFVSVWNRTQCTDEMTLLPAIRKPDQVWGITSMATFSEAEKRRLHKAQKKLKLAPPLFNPIVFNRNANTWGKRQSHYHEPEDEPESYEFSEPNLYIVQRVR